jgi:DNA-binding NarL/FixJ family response regulator
VTGPVEVRTEGSVDLAPERRADPPPGGGDGPESPAGPAVLVLGAGGLARRLAVGPLREHGLAVYEGGECPPDHRAGTVGLLVNPTIEHWHAAAAHHVPLVLLLLERPTGEGVVDAVLRGADAVVTAHDEPDELVAAITAVAAGGTLLSPGQARWIAEAARGRRPDSGRVDALTRRELDILLSIDRGETVKQTARSLGISAKTVENLQSRLFRKLAVRNRAQAVSRAHALGLLAVGPEPWRPE